jgi:hypothetical protein
MCHKKGKLKRLLFLKNILRSSVFIKAFEREAFKLMQLVSDGLLFNENDEAI